MIPEPSRSLVLAAIASCLTPYATSAQAQQQPTPPIFIGVRIFPAAGGSELPSFSDRDFQVSSAGQRLPAMVQRYSDSLHPPIFAVIDQSHCTASSQLSSDVQSGVRRMQKLGWQVTFGPVSQVLEGVQYARQTEIGLPYPTSATTPVPLSQTPGLRLIFLLCTPAAHVPLADVQAAERALAPIFSIQPRSPIYGIGLEAGESIATGNRVDRSPQYTDLSAPLRDRLLPSLWPLNQPTLTAAVQTARQMRSQFFLLRVAQASRANSLHLNVRIRGFADRRFSILAQAYADGRTVPAITLGP